MEKEVEVTEESRCKRRERRGWRRWWKGSRKWRWRRRRRGLGGGGGGVEGGV